MYHLRVTLLLFHLLVSLPGIVQETPSLDQPLVVDVAGGTCGEHLPPAWTIFTLLMQHSMESRSFTFALCKHMESEDDFLVRIIRTYPDGTWEGEFTEQVDSQPVTSDERDHLVELHERALEINALDDAEGLDGSKWCLDTLRGRNHVFACFWTPTYDTGGRGLSGLRDLGEELWEWSGWDQGQGRIP